jgi:glycosyltransferase involved in cell wall biosynthesis
MTAASKSGHKLPIPVALDVSLLGMGLYHRQARTGIWRVTERLANGLSQQPDIQLSLAAPTHITESVQWAKTNWKTNRPRFLNSRANQQRARFENTLLAPFGPETLPSKVIREGFFRLNKATGRLDERFATQNWPGGTVYHSPFFAIPEAIRLARQVKKVQMIHDLIPVHHPEWFRSGEQTLPQVLASLQPDMAITVISQATKDDFCNHTNFDPARVSVIHLAASSELFYPELDLAKQQDVQNRLGIGDGPYLLSLATLEPRKNVAHLIRCFARLVESGEIPADVQLVLAGTKGWNLDAVLQNATLAKTIERQLILTGFVADADLAALYSGALAFVYPSLYEGFGLPPLEAMQCGLPVITSNVSSLPEVVGDAALTVTPTNADELCEVLRRVIHSETLRAELRIRGLAQAKLFSWDKFVQQHIELYNRLPDWR